MASVKEIEALLPQTQCRECGFAGCLPYAEALAQGSVALDKCAPGGIETLKALGQLLHVDTRPYEASVKQKAPAVANIRESECIGCTKCIQACPVDAIVGAAKWMHTVITHECTGCGLCIEPCPVDCIDMVNVSEQSYDKEIAKHRYHQKQVRMLREEQDQQQKYKEKKEALSKEMADKEAKQQYILEAMKRSTSKNKR